MPRRNDDIASARSNGLGFKKGNYPTLELFGLGLAKPHKHYMQILAVFIMGISESIRLPFMPARLVHEGSFLLTQGPQLTHMNYAIFRAPKYFYNGHMAPHA